MMPIIGQAFCPINVRLFPFDRQKCEFIVRAFLSTINRDRASICTQFGAWSHENDSVTYSIIRSDVSLDDFYDNQEWLLVKHKRLREQE